MLVFPLLWVVFALIPVTYEDDDTLFNDPLTVTVTPKIWDLLDTKSKLISKIVKSIRFPEISKEGKLLDYNLWDGYIEQLSISKDGVSFEDIDNGVHLHIENINFRVVTKAKVRVGFMLAKVGASGKIWMDAVDGKLDLKLKWNDFEFLPTVETEATLHFNFTNSLKSANLFKENIRKYAEKAVRVILPEAIVGFIKQSVNPRLKKLKKIVVGLGLSQFGVQWAVQNNTLRVAVRPKSGMENVRPIHSSNKMICVSSGILAVLQIYIGESNVSLFDGRMSFMAPEGSCTSSSCSYCADLDVNLNATKADGTQSELSNCVPPKR
ncbi:hypothetical protein RB195_013623 [Necator americanus]|uniref:Lipid-binding serum glycoprotein N-terminal domain-containing protein n=1 Tax=Necator americanus TaxID=51031 RepID=A0ABR1DWE2_NECAM